MRALLIFLFFIIGLLNLQADALKERDLKSASAPEVTNVFIIPVTDVIDSPNLYILRRGLKEAIIDEVNLVVLDMDTPGGRVDICLEMMEMLDRFEGETITYVNEDAISAGSFIAAATDSIYFSPRGKIGASAVIQGTGEDVPESARQKIESYLRANIRVMSTNHPYRAEVIRAMMDADFELKVGDAVIKPVGELLTLTAEEAIKTYGDPPEPLLGAGIYESVESLLEDRYGAQGYVVKAFEVSYSEVIAKWMQSIAPALMGFGLLLLFIEFKTPGWGIFGIGGIALIAIFFVSQYIAGLAGNEVIVLFLLGVVLVFVEILVLPGIFIAGLAGFALMLGSLLWAMVDYWPGGTIDFSIELLYEPMMNLVMGLVIAAFGGLLLSRSLKGSWFERSVVLSEIVGGGSQTVVENSNPNLCGAQGIVVKPLHPVGEIEIAGVRYAASCAVGTLDEGVEVQVISEKEFNLVVEAIEV